MAPYLLIKNNPIVPHWVIPTSIGVHTLGCVLMMASDTQKYWTLKYRRGLITDGWFARCRNTNYLGEMMIYGSYALNKPDICCLIYTSPSPRERG